MEIHEESMIQVKPEGKKTPETAQRSVRLGGVALHPSQALTDGRKATCHKEERLLSSIRQLKHYHLKTPSRIHPEKCKTKNVGPVAQSNKIKHQLI